MRATRHNIRQLVIRIGDGTVKSDRSVVVLHHFGLGRTIGFQAALKTLLVEASRSSHQLIVRSRCLRGGAGGTCRTEHFLKHSLLDASTINEAAISN